MPPKRRKHSNRVVGKDSFTDSEESEDGNRPQQHKRQFNAALQHGLVSTFFAPQRGTNSNKTIADLNINAGDEGALRSLVTSLPERFSNEKASLKLRYEAQFGRWWSQWTAGHSLLFYGYGSKRSLLQKFACSCTRDGACISVNGFNPNTTVKKILMLTAAVSMAAKPSNFRNNSISYLLEKIGSLAEETRRIYIIIHNIDGPGLRDVEDQRLLSELASLPNIHLAASIDHLNAPNLWNLQTKDRFSWLWHHISTYEPYNEEVAAVALPSLLAGRKEGCTQQSALVVLSSLSNTAREVFRLVADAQLDENGAGGITFQRLFASCREKFLVSNEMLLKAFLTEFRDHGLLQSKRGQDGDDVLHVPLDNASLQHVLKTMEM